jgi:hypothetical protein
MQAKNQPSALRVDRNPACGMWPASSSAGERVLAESIVTQKQDLALMHRHKRTVFKFMSRLNPMARVQYEETPHGQGGLYESAK